MRSAPCYSLKVIKDAIRDGAYSITRQAHADADELGLDEEDILECVLCLYRGRSFYKSILVGTGREQDVYKARFCGHNVYIKIRISRDGRAAIISFKADESPSQSYGQVP